MSPSPYRLKDDAHSSHAVILARLGPGHGRRLLDVGAASGTYNLSNAGPVLSWAEIAQAVFRLAGRDESDVSSTTTAAYFADKPEASPRPLNSAMSLAKIEATGFVPEDASVALERYLSADA